MKPLAITLCSVLICGRACAEYINGDIHSDVFNMSNNTIISDGVILDARRININAAIYLQNKGNILGDIFICDGCRTYISNSSQIDGTIFVGKNSSVVHVITSNQDSNTLNIDGNHELLIYKAHNLGWDTALYAANGANTITIVDSVIYMSAPAMIKASTTSPTITMVGDSEFHITMNDIVQNQPILSNISGDGSARIHISGISPIYAAHAFVRDGNLFAAIVRETDYIKILGNDTGVFLNALRLDNPYDRLLMRLDSATHIKDIHQTLHKSMRTNTRRLNIPLKTLARHIATNNIVNQPLLAQSFAVFGQNISSYGTGAGTNISIGNQLQLSANVYAATMYFTDGIDDFTGDAVGINMAARYDSKLLYSLTTVGLMRAYLQTPTLQSGTGIKQNPRGDTTYVSTDIGPRLDISHNLSLIPFVGANGVYTHVLKSDNSIAGRLGALAEYKHQTTDIEYTYGTRITTDSQNIAYIDAYIGVTSPDDNFTIRTDIGVTDDEIGHSYHIIASGVFNF